MLEGMRRLLFLLLLGLLVPVVASAQSWMGPASKLPPASAIPTKTPEPPAPPRTSNPAPAAPTLVSLGFVQGDGDTALEVISLNGRTRARVSSLDGGIDVWQTMSGADPRRLFAGLERVTTLALDRAGRRLAAGDATGRIRVWSWEADRSPVYREDSSEPILRLAFMGGRRERLVAITAQPQGEKPQPRIIDLSAP